MATSLTEFVQRGIKYFRDQDTDNKEEVGIVDPDNWVVIDLEIPSYMNLYDQVNIETITKELKSKKLNKHMIRWSEDYTRPGIFKDYNVDGVFELTRRPLWNTFVAIRCYNGKMDRKYPNRTVKCELWHWLDETIDYLKENSCLDEDNANELQYENTIENLESEIQSHLTSDSDLHIAARSIMCWLNDNGFEGQDSDDSSYESYDSSEIFMALYKTGLYDPDEYEDQRVVYYKTEQVMYFNGTERQWYWNNHVKIPDECETTYAYKTRIYDANTDELLHTMAGDYEYTDFNNDSYHSSALNHLLDSNEWHSLGQMNSRY